MAKRRRKRKLYKWRCSCGQEFEIPDPDNKPPCPSCNQNTTEYVGRTW